MEETTNYQVGLYLRLSKDDMQQGESVSISTQRAILTDYCNKHQLTICKTYTDDGYSGTCDKGTVLLSPRKKINSYH